MVPSTKHAYIPQAKIHRTPEQHVHHMRKKHSHAKLIRDLGLIVLSFVITITLIRAGLIEHFLTSFKNFSALASFIAGVFFTSLFTIAPASIALVKIGSTTPPVLVAFWGAFGAVLGDYILFKFIRDSLAEDVIDLVKRPSYKRILAVFHLRIFRWFIPLVGALIIVSPLPDELGLAMMGFSRIRTRVMLPLTFFLNFLGILLIFAIAGIV
jgi:hypothetical protein